MKQFKTALKVKYTEEHQLLEILTDLNLKIKTIDNEIQNINSDIKSFIININSNNSINDRKTYQLILEGLKHKINIINGEKNKVLGDIKVVENKLINKKQEIKSIENIIEKKEQELYQLILKKEQEQLDELNTTDY